MRLGTAVGLVVMAICGACGGDDLPLDEPLQPDAGVRAWAPPALRRDASVSDAARGAAADGDSGPAEAGTPQKGEPKPTDAGPASDAAAQDAAAVDAAP